MQRHLEVELLEDRLTPSTLDFASGVISYTGTPGVKSDFTLSLSGSTYVSVTLPYQQTVDSIFTDQGLVKYRAVGGTITLTVN